MWLSTFDKVKALRSLPLSVISHSKHSMELNSDSNLTGISAVTLHIHCDALTKHMLHDSRAWASGRMLNELGTHVSVGLAPLTTRRALWHGTMGLLCLLEFCVHRCFVLPLCVTPLYMSELTFMASVHSDFWDVYTFLLISSRLLAPPCPLLLRIAMGLSCAPLFLLCSSHSLYSWPSLLIILCLYFVT